jgi:toxin ParE1/3/4
VRAIEQKFEPLRDMPLLGAARNQLAPGLRVIFHSRYAIYYVARDEEVVIVRVIHGARDATALGEHGGFEE